MHKIKDDGTGHTGPVIFAAVGFSVATIFIVLFYFQSVADHKFQAAHLPFHEGPYVAPAGCIVKEWSYGEVMPHACDTDSTRLDFNTHHLYTRSKGGHLIRMGHDAYEVACNIFGIAGCEVRYRLADVFAY